MSAKRNKNLRRGETKGHGGKREGAGPKTNAFKEKCARFTDKYLLAFAEKVMAGEKIDPRIYEGQVIYTEASVDSKTFLLCRIAEWGHGKARETLAVTNPDGTALVLQVPLRDQGEAGKVK